MGGGAVTGSRLSAFLTAFWSLSMAGTPKYVKVTGNPSSDVLALAAAVNALITSFDTHTHKTPTSNPGATSTPTSDAGGSGSTGGTAALTAACPIYDVNTGAAVVYTDG